MTANLIPDGEMSTERARDLVAEWTDLLTSMYESGVSSFGLPCSSNRPALIMAFLREAFGPNPHFRG